MAPLPREKRLGKPLDDALLHALRLHGKQARKGKDVPYAAHLLGTAATVLDFGGDEAQAVAALLHDAAEDHGGRDRLAKIRRRFGKDVARMVEDCTDTFEKVKPPWRERKAAYVASLRKKGPRSLLVSAADKLNNVRAIVADLRVHGPRTLERFAGGSETVWYYRELVKVLRGLDVGPIVEELAVEVAEMARLAGQETAPLVEAARRVARFMETRDDAAREGAFASGGVVIVESFAPFLFTGPGAVDRWAGAFRRHVRHVTGLRHAFDPPFEPVVDGDRAWLSLPTTWTGVERGVPFVERGGWSFALVREQGSWRVAGYGWAPTGRHDG